MYRLLRYSSLAKIDLNPMNVESMILIINKKTGLYEFIVV